MSEKIINEFLGVIIELIDLYLNYNGKDFPKFHEARVKFNEYALLSVLLFLLIIISATCGPCCILICFLCFLFIIITSLYYLIISVYLYFFYDGINIINNPLIHFFLWFSILPFIFSIFKIFFKICGVKTNNTHSINNDSNQQNNYNLLV